MKKKYSGQFRLRIPKSLHAWLDEESKKEGVSQNTLVIAILEKACGRRRDDNVGEIRGASRVSSYTRRSGKS